jgi:hypothetical protein
MDKYIFKKFLFIMTIIAILQGSLIAESGLRFDSNKKFKIVQFTDVHWEWGSGNCDKTMENIESVINIEQPDFVVFTGDIVTSDGVKKAWEKISEPIIDADIPWAFVNGNHDHEHELDRAELIEFMQTLPNFIGENGPKDVSGDGNYSLTINSSNNSEKKFVMYFFDSHAHPDNYLYGQYDRIKFDQIQWYYQKSNNLKEETGETLPAFAFFHIPLLEYKGLMEHDKYAVGSQYETPASSEINSGLFNAFLEFGDVMGVFVGHDHINDYIGNLYGISLGYGRVSGFDAVGDRLNIGARVIELRQGQRKFTTWIRSNGEMFNKYHFPNNEVHEKENSTYLPARKLKTQENGIKYSYYEGQYKSVDEIKERDLIKTGVLKNISLEPSERDDYFGIKYSSWLKVPQKGIYKFIVSSDDGSVLFIDAQEVVNNDGSHSVKRKSGIIGLEKGIHKFDLHYFEDYAGDSLEIKIQSLKMGKQKLPSDMLFIRK